jgi:hypothetical protein
MFNQSYVHRRSLRTRMFLKKSLLQRSFGCVMSTAKDVDLARRALVGHRDSIAKHRSVIARLELEGSGSRARLVQARVLLRKMLAAEKSAIKDLFKLEVATGQRNASECQQRD